MVTIETALVAHSNASPCTHLCTKEPFSLCDNNDHTITDHVHMVDHRQTVYVVHVTVMYMYVGSVYVPHGTDRQMSHVKKTGTLHGECRHVRNTQGPEHLLWHITL